MEDHRVTIYMVREAISDVRLQSHPPQLMPHGPQVNNRLNLPQVPDPLNREQSEMAGLSPQLWGAFATQLGYF